jgi:hypothetical protein
MKSFFRLPEQPELKVTPLILRHTVQISPLYGVHADPAEAIEDAMRQWRNWKTDYADATVLDGDMSLHHGDGQWVCLIVLKTTTEG